MLTSSSILLLVCPVVFLIAAVRKRNETFSEASRPLAFLLYVLPAVVLVSYALLWHQEATCVLLELRAIAFRSLSGAAVHKPVGERQVGQGRIVIGDVAKEQETARPRVYGTLVFRPHAHDVGMLTIELPPPEARGGLIATSTGGIVGAEALNDGDQVCVGTNCWTYDEETASFAANGVSVSIPPRRARIPGTEREFTLPWAAPLQARTRTYALEWLASRGAVSAAATSADRIRSFFCYSDPEHRLRVVVLDRHVTIQRGGRRVPVSDTVTVSNGARLSFLSLPNATDSFAGLGITERRSVLYRAGRHSYVLALDTPEIRSLTVDELRSLGLGNQVDRQKQLAVNLSMGNAQMFDRSLYLAGLSESVALQASSLYELSPLFPRDTGSAYRVISPRGPVDASIGETVWIGATDLAAIRFNVAHPPLLLLLAGLLLAVLKYFCAVRGGLTTHQLLFAGALECLAGIRLLIGYRIWAMPPHRVEGFELALTAWMTLPWLFLAASTTVELPDAPRRSARAWLKTSWVPVAAGWLFSLVFSCLIVEGRLQFVWIGMHAIAAVVPVLRQRAAWDKASPDASSVARRWKFFETLRAQRMMGVLVAAMVPCAARLMLLLAGYKEALLGTGGRISLSAIHIPVAVIIEGIYFFRVWQQAQNRGVSDVHLGVGFSLLLLLWGIPGLATSDIGLALLNVPVFALLLVMLHRRTLLRSTRMTPANVVRRILVWLPAAVVCVLVVIAPLGRFLLPFVTGEQTMLALASDANYARFLHFAEPERLRELATKRGESLAITSAILQSYIGSGLLGRGYGATEVTSLLGDTALRDFAPAVFVAAEWGFVGTTTLLVLYSLFLLLGLQAAPWIAGQGTPGSAIAAVAAATIAISSIYMILANHELLLLTGKNAYLLGLDSAGDLVEFAFLMLLVAGGTVMQHEPQWRNTGAVFGGHR